MLETEHNSDSYIESDNSSWPSTGYKFNKEKSGCIDNTGNKIESSLSYDVTTNIATVETGVTTKCYLYFEKRYSLEELCESGEDTLGDCLTSNNSVIESLDNTAYSGMYRYTGTQELVDDNYICFGTTNKDTCVNNPDTYMYRIIGITSEDNVTLGLKTNQLKLIKDTSIGTHEWHGDIKSDTKWEDSTMYSYLQNDLLNNTTYFPNDWSNKIDTIKWNIGNATSYGTGSDLFENENSTQTTNQSKIGLIYISDYYYSSHSGGGINCFNSSSDSNTCQSWLTDSKNNTWTMSRYGYNYGWSAYITWFISNSYSSSTYPINEELSVRPVFYLNSDEQYISGNGTIDDPIMLSAPKLTAGETILSNPTTGLNTTMEGGLYRYQGTTADNYICFGYSNAETDCDFTNSTNSDRYAYRIIGINENGQLKLIKKEALNETMQWWTNYTTYKEWPDNLIYPKINGNSYLSNDVYISDVWINKIANFDWKYGSIANNSETISYNANSVFEVERKWENTVNSKIGLMYVSDYLYSYGVDGNPETAINASKGWIHISHNDINLGEASELTMSRYGTNSGGSHVVSVIAYDGGIGKYGPQYFYNIRPVFYLNKDVYITNPEATGSSADPFILSY